MRTKRGILAVLLNGVLCTYGQTSWVLPGNTITTGTEYLGCNASSTQPLRFTTVPNLVQEWRTNNLLRMRLSGTTTYPTLGGFSNVNADGYLLVSPNNNFINNAVGPYSRLHLADGVLGQNTQQSGFRPWMRNGITFTGNNDEMYIGALYKTDDHSDCIVNWSDNPGAPKGDRMRFLFTSGSSTPTDTVGADGLYGVEAMRMFPETGGNEVLVGVGDYQGKGGDPTERLEVLDRTIRMRSFMSTASPSYERPTLTRVVVTDPADGRLYWRTLPTTPTACDWTVNPGATNNVSTAYSTGAVANCPDEFEAVGIGVNLTGAASAKLVLSTNRFATAFQLSQSMITATAIGATNTTTGGTASNTGASIVVTGSAPLHTGSSVSSSGGTSDNAGMRVTATAATTTADNTGITVSTVGANTNPANGRNIGVKVDQSGSTYRARGLQANTNGGVYTGFAVEGNQLGTGVQYSIGVVGTSEGSNLQSFGVVGAANRSAGLNCGLYGRAGNTAITPAGGRYGCFAAVTDTNIAGGKFGVYGQVGGATSYAPGSGRYGVFGATSDTLATSWAGYFKGRVQITNNLWHGGSIIFSDASLKTNIQPINGVQAMNLLSQLSPKAYKYDNTNPNRAYLNLPRGQQYGFLTADVQSVLPAIVASTTFPAEVDTLGNVVHPAFAVKGVNYTALIPLMVAAMKEQDARIDQQGAQIQQLQQQLAQCCNGNGQGNNHSMEQSPINSFGRMDTDLQIIPNPVASNTQLRYTVAYSGRVRLEVILGGTTSTSLSNVSNYPLSPSFQFVPEPGYVGWAILTYRPKNFSTGATGNITHIYIEIWPEDECASQSCNIVNGGNLDDISLMNWHLVPHRNFKVSYGNTPDLFAWQPLAPAAWGSWSEIGGIYGGGGSGDVELYCGPPGGQGPVPPSYDGQTSNRYASMLAPPGAVPNEGLEFELCRPLIPGNTYELSYWAMNAGSCGGTLRLWGTPVRVCNHLQGVTSLTTATPCNGMVVPAILPPSGPVLIDPEAKC